MDIDYSKIKKLIKMLEQSKLTELEINDGDKSVRLSKGAGKQVGAIPYAPVPMAAPAPTVSEATAPAPVHKVENMDQTPAGHEVKSPMVGTLYRAASPGDAPFVEVGQQVKAGDTVCIIEAMKMMNQIEADVSGKVVSILVENGNPVEYDQILIVIEEDK